MTFSKISSYVYFSVGVVLLSAVTLLQLTCPVDNGTGKISGAGGLTVTDLQYTLDKFEIFDTGCAEIYSEFAYSVNITVENPRSSPAVGALLVKFYDPDAVKGTQSLEDAIAAIALEQEIAENQIFITEEVSRGGQVATFLSLPVSSKFIFVDVPPNSSKTVLEQVSFRGFGFTTVSKFGQTGDTHAVSVAPPVDSITCPYSRGTGKVSLTDWLRLKAGVQ